MFSGQFHLLYDFAQRALVPQWEQQSAVERVTANRISNRLAFELMQTMADLDYKQ
jgi:hypothetical protein